MRNKFSKLALAAALGLALAFTFSCSDDDGDDTLSSNSGTEISSSGGNNGSSSSGGGSGTPDTDSFNGTWNASGGRSVVFTGNTFNYKVNDVTTYAGTFSVSGSTLIFNGGTGSCNFTLTAETVIISNHPDPSVNGTYTKVGGSGS